jgi:peptidoglycan-associated lipoprotein
MRYFAVLGILALAVAGCATTAKREQAAVDVTGRWAGSWEGFGVFEVKRHDEAVAQFTQHGNTGHGRLWLDGTLASESVPVAMRMAGASGLPVILDVRGDRLVLMHEFDDRLFKVDFVVKGDRMIGHPVDTDLPGRIVLERVKEPVAVAPPPPPPVALAPPPPPPAPEPARVEPSPPVVPPATARPSPQEFSPTETLKPVYFSFDRSEVAPSEKPTLDANVQWLRDNREVLVLIEGHCDERGTDAYNLALGERRAKSVKDYIVGQGVAADRVNTVSYGEERPACTEKTEECWRQNRRAGFIVKPKE